MQPDDGAAAAAPPAADLAAATPEAAARLAEWAGRADPRLPTILFVLHQHGGGTWRYAKCFADRLKGAANIVYGIGIRECMLLLTRDPDVPGEGVSFALPGETGGLIAAGARLGVARLNIVHALGFEARLGELLRAWTLPYDLTLTDFHLAATTPHLLDPGHRYVGDDARLAARRDRPAFVDGAERIFACSRFLAAGVQEFWPDLSITPLAPVDAAEGRTGARWRPIRPGEPMRIVLINASARLKGSAIWKRVATLALDQRLPLEFHAVAAAPTPPGLTNVILHKTEPHRMAETAAAVIAEVRPHLAWFPFQAPETYSFALSDALAMRLPILASRLGAIPERLEGRRLTWLLPFNASPRRWLATLIRLRRAQLLLKRRSGGTGTLPPAEEIFPDRYMAPLAARRPQPP